MGGSSGGDIVKKKAPVIQDMTPGNGPAVQAAALMPTPQQSSLTDYVPKSRAKTPLNPAGLSGTSLINYQALAARKALESLGVPVSRLGA